MRVVLMGRTMAGKSTLLAALTGASAERIGLGAQRTSRDVFAAPAVGLFEVEIVDTPGVGAKDGAEDVELAMAEVPGADLVLWVASNDSFQEETAQALRAVALRGKPVVVALNCRAPLVDDLDRDDFLEDPELTFAQYEGHFKTIRSHLSAAGVRPVAEVMLHAEAARQARQNDDYGADLREASRIGTLLAVLEKECTERRTARRLLREIDEMRSQALVLKEALAAVEQETREIVDIGHGMREDQKQRALRLVDACKQKMEDDVIRLVGRRQGWHRNVTDFGPRVAEEWHKEQSLLLVELDDALKARLAELSRAVDNATVAAGREWSAVARPYFRIEGLRDFRGLWMRRAAGALIGGGGALAVAAAGAKIGGVVGAGLGGPAGAFVGSVVGAGIGSVGSLFVTPLRKKVQSLFTSKAKILEVNRELLLTEIGNVLIELEDQGLARVIETIARVRAALDVANEKRKNAADAALAVADLLACQQRSVGAAISALDRDTVFCLLHSDGRPRLAASIVKATRLPGVCIAVEVTDKALAEAWLFPPSSPEVLTFGRTPPSDWPGARATSYVLGLTEEVPARIRFRPHETELTTNVQVPTPVLKAWSATLSDHLVTPVEIVRTPTPRSTTV